MRRRTSVTTIVTTVLITLITIIMILNMTHDRTANIVEAVVLMLGLFAFAGALISSSGLKVSNKV